MKIMVVEKLLGNSKKMSLGIVSARARAADDDDFIVCAIAYDATG